MHIKKTYFLIALFGLSISLSLLNNYTGGDQVHYRNFYESISDLNFFDVGPVAQSKISSNEPLTWFVLWAGSYLGIDKDVWVSFLNVVLIAGLFALLAKHKAPWYVIFLIFTNFYFLVLITTAERLKISYIILTYAFLLDSYKRYIFLLSSPGAHLQSFIFLVGLAFFSLEKQIRNSIENFKINKKFILRALGVTIIAAPLIFILKNGVVLKLNYYANSFTLFAFANITILLVVATIATANKLRMFLALAPLFFTVAVMGGDRVNMIAVTLALGILMFEHRLKHPLVLALLLYFSLKSIPFVGNVYYYGDGFYAP